MYDTIGPDIVRWRLEVLSEIGELMGDLVQDWADTLPSHVTDAYRGKGSCPRAAPVTRILLDAIGYPGASVLERELTYGFPAIGQMPLGTGWPLRECPNLKPPMPLERNDFLVGNIAYVRATASSRQPDKHADRLVAEVWEERARGRTRGPFHAHPWGFDAALPRGPASSADTALLPIPHGDCAASIAFGNEQLDPSGNVIKVRRGEDWRRSRHNQATIVRDKPRHDTVDAFVQGARLLTNRSKAAPPVHLWGPRRRIPPTAHR